MDLHQHFRREEHSFVDQVMSWKEQVESNYAPKLTDFLDPREQKIVEIIIGANSEVKVQFFGGAEQVERKRAFIYPDYYSVEVEDFQISLYELIYPNKFVSIEHRQILGSMMSLGLKRGKFGDILIEEETIQLFVANEVSDYISMQLESVGRSKVSLKERRLDEAIQMREQWNEYTTTVSSLRLDTIIAAAHNISRQKSQTLIAGGVVKINWMTIENPSFECKEDDVLSVRGYGRAKLSSIDGKTKKDKWRIVVEKHQ
ncbi:RNA-binding protein [Robertmurraya sp. GLU-23]